MGTTLHQKMNEKQTNIGCKNTIFVPLCDKDDIVIEPLKNVLISKCFKKWHRVCFTYKQHKIFKSANEKLNCNDFDCIHAYTLFTDGNCAMKLSKKYGKPYVVAIRNTDVNDFFKKMIHLRSRGIKIMRNASAIFFLSKAYREYVFEKYVPQKYRIELLGKSYIMPNGIDDFWLENQPISDKSVTTKQIKLIYAGRIDKNKNIPTTQRAMDILRQKGYDVTLTVVGKVADQNEFSKINGNEHTTYISAKPKEELIELYREHDIFVMPSYTETFGLVYAEAMSQGLPVIYTRGQGFDGQFEDGEVGCSVDPTSSEEIANKIEKIIKDYCDVSKNCLKACHKFNWEALCREYNEIYKKITRNFI